MKFSIERFTRDEVQRAKSIIKTSMDDMQAVNRILAEVVTPEVIRRIDIETRQADAPRYMAYRLQHLASNS